MTYALDDGLEVLVELLLVGVGDGADLVVVALREDAANHHLIGAHLGLGGLVQLHDVVVDLVWHNGGRVLGAVGGEYHHEVALRLHAEVALDGILEAAAESLLVGALDGAQVSVGAAKQHVVEHALLGAWPLHRVKEVVYVSQQGSASQLQKRRFKVAARLGLEIPD